MKNFISLIEELLAIHNYFLCAAIEFKLQHTIISSLINLHYICNIHIELIDTSNDCSL